jgi:hypothetical protein
MYNIWRRKDVKHCIRCSREGALLCTTSEGGKMWNLVSDAIAREYFYLRHLKEEGCETLYQMQKWGSTFIYDIWMRIEEGCGTLYQMQKWRKYFYLRHLNEDWGRMWDIVSDAEVREYFYLRHLNEDWGRMWDIVSDAEAREYFYLRHLKEEGCETLYQMQKRGSTFIYDIWRRKDVGHCIRCSRKEVLLCTTSQGGGHCNRCRSERVLLCHLKEERYQRTYIHNTFPLHRLNSAQQLNGTGATVYKELDMS